MTSTEKGTNHVGCWRVLVFCFFGNVALGGMGSTFGLFMNSIQQHFEADATTTAAVHAVFVSTMQFLSPLAAALCLKLGPAKTFFCGAVFIVASLTGSLFATSIWMMLGLFGFVNGVGASMVQIVTVTTPQHFFNKYQVMSMCHIK